MAKTPVVAEVYTFALPPVKAEVTSSNVVGYQKISLTAGNMDIIAPQFQDIGGNGTIDIQTITASGNFRANGTDSIRVYDSALGTYTRLRWFGEGYGVYAEDAGDDDDPIAETGWGDSEQTIINLSLASSQGFWGQAARGGEIIVSGEVPSSGVVQVPVGDMTLVANPFAVDTDIQTVIAGDGFRLNGVDSIRVYDAAHGTYTRLRWFGDGYGVYAEDAGDDDDPIAEQGWGDAEQTIINLTIPAGHGFWVQSARGGTLTFPNPLAPAASEGND